MIEWLDNKGISHPPKALKLEIFSIIAGLNLIPWYIVDEMAKAVDHEVVCLPVAHCTLNPIEMTWSQVKDNIKTNNHQFNLAEVSEVEHLAWEWFEVVTPERWASLIKHVD